jgi:phosphatidylglycerol---prolipoprotein diacylglyceryl transferase
LIEFTPYWIHVGPLNIHYYALILLTGMMVAAWMTARRAREQGYDPEHVWNGLFWAIIPGLIGARLYHVFTPSPSALVPGTGEPLTTLYYFQHPLAIFQIWNGGLGIFGALLGGAIGIYIYVRRQKQPLLKWFDLLVPGVAIAQAIGRWGNFVNQELYGAPTNLPWGFTSRSATASLVIRSTSGFTHCFYTSPCGIWPPPGCCSGSSAGSGIGCARATCSWST